MVELRPKYILIPAIIIFSLASAVVIQQKLLNKNNNISQDKVFYGNSLNKSLTTNGEVVQKSKFNFEILTSPSPAASVMKLSPSPFYYPSASPFLNPSPSPSLIPSPLPSPYPSLLASPLPNPSPSPSLAPSPLPSPSPSVLNIPTENIPPVPDSEIPDFAYFMTYNDSAFILSFKYHPEWVIVENSDKNKLHFLSQDKVFLIKSIIFYAFEDPDYQLGKYEIFQANVFNSEGKDLVDWLLYTDSNAANNQSKLVYQQINGRKFLRVKDKENQVYYAGNGKIYSFWFNCADYSGCATVDNEKLFRKILQTVN